MVVVFDFDGTLSDERLQTLAIKMKRERNEIWIATMRKNSEFNKNILKPVLKKIGLSEFNVIFCNDKPKWELLKSINADIYIDNVSTEFDILKNHTNVIPLLF